MVERSNAELEIIEFMKEIKNAEFISVEKFMSFGDKLSKLLLRCEELSKSRDKWRAKALTKSSCK